jgi:hypothetical protein
VAGAVNTGVNGFNAIEDGGGIKREIKGGEMKARCNGSVAPEAQSWAALGGRESVASRTRSGGWRWGTELTAGAQLSKGRGRGGQLGRREPKGKTYFP